MLLLIAQEERQHLAFQQLRVPEYHLSSTVIREHAHDRHIRKNLPLP
jgi:hypothetical protein